LQTFSVVDISPYRDNFYFVNVYGIILHAGKPGRQFDECIILHIQLAYVLVIVHI